MNTDEKWVDTICGFCHASCGMRVLVKDGRIEKVRGNLEHPANRGKLCPKGAAAKEVVHSPERLRYPLGKTKRGFERISWDEALDRIAESLVEIKEKYGPETLLVCRGATVNEEIRDGFVEFMSAYGSPNIACPAHLCFLPRRMGMGLVCGTRTTPDYDNTECMVIWGANLTESRTFNMGLMANGNFDRVITEAKKRGAKLIVIDPMYTELAAMADEWINIALETDMALALAMLNVIIEGGLYDKEFVESWTVGFDKLKDHVRETTPEWAEKITRVPADKIRKIAYIYAAAKPAMIFDGNGLELHPNVVQTVRAIGMLVAITGNIDVPGGNLLPPLSHVPYYPSTNSPPNRLGASEYPLYPEALMPSMYDALLSGKPYQPRAMIVLHGNPLLISANEKRTRAALQKLELLVVHDIFKTATAELAHVILPAASDFERFAYEINFSSQGAFLALQQKVIEPIGESRSMADVEYELAKRVGIEGQFPWKSNEEWVNYKVKAIGGVTLEDLQKQPVIFFTPPLEYKKYLKDGFNTPTKKVELYSEMLEEVGQDPLPVYRARGGDPDLVSRFPLIGTTRKPGNYVQTRFRNTPALHRLQPDPFARINPDAAQQRGIAEGEEVVVESPKGRIRLKAKITPEIRPELVVVDFGWGNPWDKADNVNILTSDEERDPISGTTPNGYFFCDVRKVQTGDKS